MALGVAREVHAVAHEEVLFLPVVGLMIAKAVGGNLGGKPGGEKAAVLERRWQRGEMKALVFSQDPQSFDELGTPGDEFFELSGLVVELDGDFFANLAVVFGMALNFVRKENGFFDGEIFG